MSPLVEICVDDCAGALVAEAAGADSIELCAALSEGGLTPSIGMVGSVLRQVQRVGVQVMIRPRGGRFEISPEMLGVMLADIAAVRALSAPVAVGFVFGALTPVGRVDEDVTAALVAACGNAPTTFHKAFDLVADPIAALDTLVNLGVQKVLTSGGAERAIGGVATLARLMRHAAGRIGIIAAGTVRVENMVALVAATGVREIHLRAMRATVDGSLATSRAEIDRVLEVRRHLAAA